MKKFALINLAILFSLTILSVACGKGGDDDKPCFEAALQITTSPANGSTEAPGIGPTFPLQVNITNNLPAAGVTIEVSAAPEAGGTAFFSQTLPDVRAAISNFTITNTPGTTPSLVKITVISKSCATNKWSGSYRYSKK